MRKPALYLAAALIASLLAASTVTSIVALGTMRRSRNLLLAIGSSQALLSERVARLSLRRDSAEALPPDPVRAEPAAAGPPPAAPAVPPPPYASNPAEEQANPPAGALSDAPLPATPPAHEAQADLPLQQELADGLRSFDEARYQEAASRFAGVLARQPENTQAHQYYAASLYRANPGASPAYQEIERHLLRVLREQPDNAPALELLGRVNAEQERWPDALVHFQRVLELRPEDPECLRSAGLCALYNGDYEAAERYFLRAGSLNGEVAELWHFAASAQARAGRLEEAVAGYRKCLELDPGFQEARLRAGLALLELGRHREARELLREYVKARPGAEGLAALGDCAYALGEKEEAQELWRESLARMNPRTPREKRRAAELYVGLSRAAWQRQESEQSLALAERGLLCEPLPMLRALQGVGYLATGRKVRGKAVLRSLLADHPGSEAAALAAEALGRESP